MDIAKSIPPVEVKPMMDTPLIHFMAAIKEAAKQCGYAAAILEVKESSGYFVDVNVARLSDRRVIFRGHIPYKELTASLHRVTLFVTQSIYDEHARLKAEPRRQMPRYAFRLSVA